MLIIIIVLLSILLIIYIVPLPIFINLYLNDNFRGRIVVAGIIPISFPKKKKEKPAKKKKEKKRKFDVHRFIELFLDGSFRRKVTGALFRFLKRTLCSLKVKITHGNITYGSGDPARTGLIAGKYYAFRYSTLFLEIHDRFTFNPDFNNRCIKGELKGRVLIYLGRVLLAALIFIIEWPILKTLSMFKKVPT